MTESPKGKASRPRNAVDLTFGIESRTIFWTLNGRFFADSVRGFEIYIAIAFSRSSRVGKQSRKPTWLENGTMVPIGRLEIAFRRFARKRDAR
jgi:hypothetical protein